MHWKSQFRSPLIICGKKCPDLIVVIFYNLWTSNRLTPNFNWFLYWETFTLTDSTNNANFWCKNTIQELNSLEWINELNNASILVTLWRMGANADFMWSFCFNLYAWWSDFLEAKMLAHVIKFENCLTLSIRIKGFSIFKDKLTLFFWSQIV